MNGVRSYLVTRVYIDNIKSLLSSSYSKKRDIAIKELLDDLEKELEK